VILPDQKLKMLWDLIIIFVISIYFYLIPVQLSFDIFYDDELEAVFHSMHMNPNLSKFIVLIPDLVLIFDTLLKFITGFYENGVVVVNKSQIFSHYIHKGLFFDMLSYFPVLIQGILRPSFPDYFEHHSLLIKELQFLMFFKLKRVRIAISNFEEIIASKGGHDFLLSAFRLIYVILFVAHLNACLWHASAHFNPNSSKRTWLDASNLKTEYWLTKYLYSYYWAISLMATVGYGERISPQNNLEILFGIFILIISFFLFGFCLNSMKQILDNMAKQENDYKFFFNFTSMNFFFYFFLFRETVRVINGYMKKNNLEFELQSRVRKYLEYTIMNENNVEQKDAILNKLTKSLKSEVLLQSYGKYVKNNKFFNNFSLKTKEKIVMSLKEVKLSPEEYINFVNFNHIFKAKIRFFLNRNKKMMKIRFIFSQMAF